MDRKALIQALLWASVAFIIFTLLTKKLMPSASPRPGQAPTATQPAAEPSPGPATAPTASGPALSEAGPPSGLYRAVEAAEEIHIRIGNTEGAASSPFRNGLTTTNVGAATERVTVTDFAATVGSQERYLLMRPEERTSGESFFSLAVENVTIDRQSVPLADVRWHGRKGQEGADEFAHYWLDIVDEEDQPVLRLNRVYRVAPRPADEERYDVSIELRAENLTDQPMEVRLTQRGPVGIQREYSRADSRHAFAASASPDTSDSLIANGIQFAKVAGADHGVQTLYDQKENREYWWSGAGNKYFTCVVVPLNADGGAGLDAVIQAEAVDLDRDKKTTDDVTTRWVTRSVILPGTVWACPQLCYLGPNDREAFTRSTNDDYRRWGFEQIVNVQYTWCTFGWLTNLLTVLLDGLHTIVRNYGVAIIILVLIVRVLLHPITKKGQVNMVRMQERMGKLQPKLEQLKEKYGNDRARIQQESMKLYQEEGISPFTSMLGSCAPMMIQMPIWIALYTSLSNNIHMRHQPFVLWIHDLTAPDALFSFSEPHTIPLLSALTGPIQAINILPLFMGLTMYLQQKLMPKPKTETKPGASSPQMDQAAQMQKMMPIMSAFFVLIFYAMPSGLNLYIMTSSLFGMIEQWQIRKHIKEEKERRENEGGAQPAIGPKKKGPPGAHKQPNWLMRKFHELQKQAEEAQKIQSKRKKNR